MSASPAKRPAPRGLPGLCQARPRLDTNNRRGSAYARGKPWRQGRGYLASGGTAASACDGGKLPDRDVEFASCVRAHCGHVRLAGHFPRHAEACRDRCHATAEGSSGASLYRSRAHLYRRAANRPGTGSGKRGATGELSAPAALHPRPQLPRPLTRPRHLRRHMPYRPFSWISRTRMRFRS